MATHRELEAQVRFQLDQLAVRNAHHDFEHLCRHLARHRICSNILPASGPVAAGGDQGRDFETYTTSVQDPLGSCVFAARSSGRQLAFACTLQRERLPSKVKSDVRAIMASGRAADAIHFLCAADIPVAKRHELQTWASSEFDASLEIHDGQWITQELCQRDIFWIAQEYLGIARELFPDPDLEDASYRELLLRWQDARPSNLADLLDVSYGLREAARAGGPSEDLTFWLDRVSPDLVPAHLRRYAIYETAVASLRGRKSMEGLEPLIREYFTIVSDLDRTSDLDDAAVLLGFCLGASGLRGLDIPLAELRSYAHELLERTNGLLAKAETPGNQAQLLYLRGFLSAAFISPDQDGLQSCLSSWEDALELLDKSPLFPVADLAKLITLLIELLPEAVQGERKRRLLALAEQVDALVEKRYGAFAAASRSRDRGMALYRKGDLLGAIGQLHRAKRGWFAKETLQGSILAILFLSKCYYELGLGLAAKYYALAAAFMASSALDLNLRRYAPQGLFMAADSDYDLGAWCSYLLLSDVALAAFSQFGVEKDASTIESDINRTIFHAGIIYAMSSLFVPDLQARIRQLIEAWDLAEDLDDILDVAERQWAEKDPSDVTISLREDGIYSPFSDAGHRRHVGFCALGISWSLNWENTHAVNAAGEHFTAVLQVLCADLAESDLCLLPTTISVSLQLGDVTPTNSLAEGKEPGEWSVMLPSPTGGENFDLCVFTATTGLLACSSALRLEEMHKLLDERLQKALRGKTFCARPFVELLGMFVKEEDFLAFGRDKDLETPSVDCTESENPQLHGRLGPGPGYNRAEHETHIAKRYCELKKRLGGILPQLASRPVFRATAATLRANGWKDWHILLAAYNAIVNHVAKLRYHTGRTMATADRVAQMREIAGLDVLPQDVTIPDSVVSEESLRIHLHHSMAVTLQSWGLHINTHAFDAAAIEALLGDRYSYWSDDVEHDNLGF